MGKERRRGAECQSGKERRRLAAVRRRVVTSEAGVMFTNVHESRRHEQRRPYVPRHQRDGFHADRGAALAVGLALLLVFVAATSANGAAVHVAAATPHAAALRVAAAKPHAAALPAAAGPH